MLEAKLLRITCLCMLSFLLNEFSQTEQNQLVSSSQEQNVDWEKDRMLRIYIGLLLLLLLHHHHHHISIVFFYHHHHRISIFLFYHHHHRISIFLFYHHHHISIFPSKSFYKNRRLPQLVQFVSMSQVVKNNRGFLQLLAVCPAHQRHFLLRTATPKQPRGLVQVLYNVLKEYILMPEPKKISGTCSHTKML